MVYNHNHILMNALKSARATEMCVTESTRKICEQKTKTKETEAHRLTLSRIPGSV